METNTERLKQINQEITDLYKKIETLEAERTVLSRGDLIGKINKNKIYRFKHPVWGEFDEEYVGIITDCWFSPREKKYVVDFCGLSKHFDDFADNSFCLFDTMKRWEMTIDEFTMFVNELVEASDEYFNSYLTEWLTESKENIKEWFNYYKNKSYDKEEY